MKSCQGNPLLRCRNSNSWYSCSQVFSAKYHSLCRCRLRILYSFSWQKTWASNKQKVTFRSTTEAAEYRSIAAALTEIKWAYNLLHELCITFQTSTLYSNNLGILLLVANPIMHSKTKHFDLDLHFV